ncbi:MAG: tRNA lysidine(34) synthetase TilS [Alphaproteobacteria bacterium]|nr:tRNA lysidine(34) synthetase TilS [Alphaproteobacteria bacterium]
MSELALAAEDFARLMESFDSVAPRVALAVSGGPDSMALAFCAQRWRKSSCVALIVEHGLREESAEEAATVQRRLKAMGIDAEILPWHHEDSLVRVHEAARRARYDLLTSACRRLGAGDLLMAHHRGDQAETVLMRLAKGSGLDGLAGIDPCLVRDGIRILRPFLTIPRARLEATCRAANIAVVHDPSNASEKYARGRLRKVAPLLEREGFTEDRLIALRTHARDAREALEIMTRDFLARSGRVCPGGVVCVARDALATAPRAVALRALRASLRYVHEGPYPPSYDALEALLAAAWGDAPTWGRTVHGCMISASSKSLRFFRELAAVSERVPLSAGQSVLWDDRWLVSSRTLSGVVRPLGVVSHAVCDAVAPDLRARVPWGRARATLPSLWDGDTLLAVPSFDSAAPLSAVYVKQTFP